jgi:hypothetical protein
MKILFITHEGIDSSIFNSQVLIHAMSMKKLGIYIDILSYNTNKRTKLLSLSNYNKLLSSKLDINIILKSAFNIYLPFSALLNGFLLALFLVKNKNKYSILHCRSDYTTFVALITKFIHKKKVIWDCRGDSLNELSDALLKKSSLTQFLGGLFLKPINKFEILISAKFSNAAIFVSNALYNTHSDKIEFINFKIIPCLVSEELFFFNKELRYFYRNKYKINDNDRVFLYSGSLVSYQALNLQEDFYRRILKDTRNIIIFATVDVKQAKEYFHNKFNNRFLILNVPFEEMNSYYNLSDFAILLRDTKQLNWVASPTKFGEYCLTGLPVIMNDTIEQSMEFSKQIGNYLNWNLLDFEKFDNELRLKVANTSRKYFARNEINKRYYELYYTLNY